MPDLLLSRRAYERIQGRLEQIDPMPYPWLIEDDGRVTLGGAAVQPEHIAATAAWLSIDLYAGPIASFAAAVLAAPHLRWLQSASAGLDDPMFAAFAAKGIRISNSNAMAPAIAEFVIASVLDHYQRGPQRREAQRAHRWEKIAFREVAGSEWLILGMGSIGKEIARRAKALDARVFGIRRNPAPVPFVDEVYTPASLHARLGTADVVVVAVPLTAETAGMVDQAFLSAMRPGQTTLVNIARGGHIDEAALAIGLEQGKPDYAILDVFESEPLPSHSHWWDHPRIAVTAHASPYGSGLEQRTDALFVANLASFAADQPLLNEVSLADYIVADKH